MYALYLLFARKGIAEYRLGISNYVDTLNKCIHLLEINKQYELALSYKQIMKDKYNITL
ncbi:hypothetical protein [Alkaliphilus serpentinus]|uniref:hypothetical protein n=1 Tax=Alkaliphilus serpentinus TaxID=1482731 RepID=UPI0018658226|nr:hypothetical protein [Alkaliphilus serpentinus]